MSGFSKSKVLDRKGESIIDRISDLARRAEAIADTDSGGSETARLKRMLEKVTDELDKACEELEKAMRERTAVKTAFALAQEELKKAKIITSKLEKDAVKLREMIRRYGELESGLGKAVDKVIEDIKKVEDIDIQMPRDDIFE